MSVTVTLKKGLDIKIAGHSEKNTATTSEPSLYAIKPTDFPGLIPKLMVKPGDRVLAGSPLFHDKLKPEIFFTSPVAGRVEAINRGERRMLLEILVRKEGDDFVRFGTRTARSGREQIKKMLLDSGLWPCIRQRPYHVVADPAAVPKAIFVSGFDSSPLAPDYNYIVENSSHKDLWAGFSALKTLTEGKLHLVLNGRSNPAETLKNVPDVEISYFSGPHPAGNVGIHIHHLDPVGKGESVWYINLPDVITVGRLMNEGIYKPEKLIALTGSEVIKPQYYRLLTGASIKEIVNGNVNPGKLRYISGNVLTGKKIEQDGCLGFYDSQVTVIPEGDYYEFFGWLKPGTDKFSFYRAFASKFLPRRSYRLDTNLHGGERAFVLTGNYEKVLPMDILPMQLFKAIMAADIDNMENLGIYEVAEEDFALCEYICPSKIEIQSVIRNGIDLMIKEMS